MLTLAGRLKVIPAQFSVLPEQCSSFLQLFSLPEQCASSVKEQRRGMARGRNYYIKGASQKQQISEEARELLKNRRQVIKNPFKRLSLTLNGKSCLDLFPLGGNTPPQPPRGGGMAFLKI